MRDEKLDGAPGSEPLPVEPIDLLKLCGWSMASGLLFGFAVVVGAVASGHYSLQKQTNAKFDTVRIKLLPPVPAPGFTII